MNRLLVLCACILVLAGRLAAADRPNIIVFLIDDMGIMDTSLPFLTNAAGKAVKYPLNEYYRTPNMERHAGLQAPSTHAVDGMRLDSLLAGKPDRSREQTFLMHYPHSPHRTAYFTSYREGPWKVVYHYFPSDVSENLHYQLFNLGKDPFESTNLATAEPAELRRMMQRLIASLERHQAQYPLDKESAKPLKPRLP